MLLKTIWKDPVWSKVIALSIITIAVTIAVVSFKTSSIKSETPTEIFTLLTPGASVNYMREVLGTPHREGIENAGIKASIKKLANLSGEKNEPVLTDFFRNDIRQYSYIFDNTLVQIRSTDGISITELMVANRYPSTDSQFLVFPSKYVLGLSNLEEIAEETEILNNSSTEHSFNFVKKYFEAQGRYLNYFVGIYNSTNIEASQNGNINWAGVTVNDNQTLYFDWAHFR